MKIIEKLILMGHHPVAPVVNLAAQETASAGLGSIGQYGIILFVLLVIGLIFWKTRKK
jgi:hypothetical protein